MNDQRNKENWTDLSHHIKHHLLPPVLAGLFVSAPPHTNHRCVMYPSVSFYFIAIPRVTHSSLYWQLNFLRYYAEDMKTDLTFQ